MDIEPFSLPLSRPLATAAGTIEARRGFLVRVAVEGTPGLGEATPLPGWTESRNACENALSAVTEPVSTLEAGRLSATAAARHGVSLAVLDARARAAGRPLYRYLGGDRSIESVPANATVGDGKPSETAAAVERAAAAGYPAVKLKVGARDIEADLGRVEAARSAAPEIELRLDANGAWSYSAVDRILPRLAAFGVSVLEQPLPASSFDEHAALRGRGLEIALDESVVEHGVEAVLETGACDLLVCKPMALGGVDVARETIENAREVGLDAIVTTTIDGAVARAAAVHLVASVPDMRPCGIGTGGLLETDLREGVAPVEGGRATVPQGKGNIPPR